MTVVKGQTLETNRELHIARANHVLDLKVCELGLETEFLDDAGVFSGCQLRLLLALGAGNNL